MTLQEKIQSDLHNLIVSRGSQEKINLLKVVIAELSRFPKKEVDDNTTISVLKKMKEGAIACNKPEEVSILENYLPKMLTEEEIKVIVSNLIEANNFTMKDIGTIMKTLNNYGPQLDKSIAMKIVKNQL